jgi:hypothetical protein
MLVWILYKNLVIYQILDSENICMTLLIFLSSSAIDAIVTCDENLSVK